MSFLVSSCLVLSGLILSRTPFYWILAPNGDPNGDQNITLGGPRRPSEPPRMCFEGVFLWTSVLTSLLYPKILQKSKFFRDAQRGRNVANNISKHCFSCLLGDPVLKFHLGPFLTLFWHPFGRPFGPENKSKPPRGGPRTTRKGVPKNTYFQDPLFCENGLQNGRGPSYQFLRSGTLSNPPSPPHTPPLYPSGHLMNLEIPWGTFRNFP